MATSHALMFAAVGVDSFVVVTIRSLPCNNHALDGTRLTKTKLRIGRTLMTSPIHVHTRTVSGGLT